MGYQKYFLYSLSIQFLNNITTKTGINTENSNTKITNCIPKSLEFSSQTTDCVLELCLSI